VWEGKADSSGANFYSMIVLDLDTFCFLSFQFIITAIHVKWVPCLHDMARPQVADGGGGLQIWRVAANILNKQSRTAVKGWSSSLRAGRGANNSPP
jgi:hypothetical protein